MSNVLKLHKGGERPSFSLTWKSSDGSVIDLSTGHSFELKIGSPGANAVFTKTTGITGAQTSPNLIVTFSADELAPVLPGLYVSQIRARETAGNQDRFMQLWLRVLDVVN